MQENNSLLFIIVQSVMARVHGEIYLVTIEPEKSQLAQLCSLKVNDKIVIKGTAYRMRLSIHAPSCQEMMLNVTVR